MKLNKNFLKRIIIIIINNKRNFIFKLLKNNNYFKLNYLIDFNIKN